MADIMEQVLKRAELFGYLSYMNADEPSVEMRKRIYNMYGDLLEYKVRPTEFLAGLIEHNIEVYKVVCNSTIIATLLSKMNEDPAVQLASGSFINNVQDANTGIKTLIAIGNELGFDTEYVYSVEELRTALSNFKYAEFKPNRLMGNTDKSEETPPTENRKNLDGEWEAPEDEEDACEIQYREEIKKLDEQFNRIDENLEERLNRDKDSMSDEEYLKAIRDKESKMQERLKAIDNSRRANQVSNALKESEDEEIDMSIVEKTLNTIMSVYDKLYAPLFEMAPVGILVPDGILSIKSDNAMFICSSGKEYAKRMFSNIKSAYGNAVRDCDYHEDISLDCINPDGTLKYNYVPSLQVRNIFGVYRDKDGLLHRETNWNKFRGKLVGYLTKQITNLLKSFEGDRLVLSDSLVELFTTSYIVEEFDINKSISLSMKSIGIQRSDKKLDEFGVALSQGRVFPIDTTTLDLVNNSSESVGIHNILLILDKEKYNKEICFAYKPIMKLVESGSSVSIKNALLGRDMNGKNVTHNFEDKQQIVMLMIAGSGSGKGVMTLNILATFLASGCPVVYADYKPDMAGTLWDLERKTGAKILAIDSAVGRTASSKPIRNYGLGHSLPNIPTVSEKLKVISYLKLIQIMVCIAQARRDKFNGLSSSGKKMEFILDEAQAFNKDLNSLYGAVKDYVKENKPSKTKPETDEYRYCVRLKEVLDTMQGGTQFFKNTVGRVGNVGVLLIGQQPDATSWVGSGAMRSDALGVLVGTCNAKLIGKDGNKVGSQYGYDAVNDIAGIDFLTETGYWVYAKGAEIDKSMKKTTKVIKSYLVLNENDYEVASDGSPGPGEFTSGVLSKTSSPQTEQVIDNDFYTVDKTTGNRTLNKLIGFEGLVEYMGKNNSNFDLKTSLEAGYKEVDKFLNGLGITGEDGVYSCIEEYLYDCSIGSLFSIPEIQKMITEKKTIKDFGASNRELVEQTSENEKDNTSFKSTAKLSDVIEDDEQPAQKSSTLSEEDRLRQDLGVASSARTPQELEDLFAQGVINEVQKNIALNEMLTRQAEGRQPLAQEQTPQAQPQTQGQNTEFTQQVPQQQVQGQTQGQNTAFTQQAQQPFTQQEQPTSQEQNTLTKEEIDKGAGDTISEILGMFDDSVVDTLNATAAVLVDMTYNGRIHPLIAEEVARRLNLVGTGNLTNNDFVNGNARHIPSKIVQEYVTKISNDGKQAMSYTGRNGETVTIDTAQTRNFINLNESNSMDASSVANVFGNPRLLMNTPKGAERYLKNLWKGILDKVISSGIPAPTITRVSLIGNMMSVNGKMVYLGGVLGGSQGLQLKDIVEFKTLFKKFPMIGELMIDEEMLQVALLEFGTEPLGKLFDLGRKLRFIRLMERNGAVKDNITRENMDSHELRSTIQRNTLRNNIALYCQNMKTDGNWDMDKLADNVWGLKLARGCMGNAGEAFLDKTKPKVGRAVFYSCAGVMFGAIGSVAWGISRAGKGLFDLSKGFRR